MASIACRHFLSGFARFGRRFIDALVGSYLVSAIELLAFQNPFPGVPEVADQLGVAGMKEGSELLVSPSVSVKMVLADPFEELSPHSCALPFGHHYQPGSPVALALELGADGHVADQLIIDRTNEVVGGNGHGKV